MVRMNNLKPNVGSNKKDVRIGRGQGSGNGCTAGKGMNGAKARRGHKTKFYFEGGQTPLTRRIPKKGFNNIFKKSFQIVNIGDLEKLDVGDKEINAEVLFENGLIHSKDKPVKILGNGELTKDIVVKVDAYSKTAREKLKIK